MLTVGYEWLRNVAEGYGTLEMSGGRRGSNTLPSGVFNMAARNTKSPNVAVNKIANIMTPNICVGVKVLNANAAKPKPAINVV